MTKIAFALALVLGLSVVAVATADAQSRPAGCRYTSADVAKGYRC